MAGSKKVVPIESAALPSLEDYVTSMEYIAQQSGCVLTLVQYPDAAPRIFPGKFAGIPVEPGELSARMSSGEYI